MNSTNVFINYTFLEGKSTMIIKITLKLFLSKCYLNIKNILSITIHL